MHIGRLRQSTNRRSEFNALLSVFVQLPCALRLGHIEPLVTRIFPHRKVPGFAKYAIDANLFRLESSILTRAKLATNRNNVATENRGGGGVYLEPKTYLIFHVEMIQ